MASISAVTSKKTGPKKQSCTLLVQLCFLLYHRDWMPN